MVVRRKSILYKKNMSVQLELEKLYLQKEQELRDNVLWLDKTKVRCFALMHNRFGEPLPLG